MSTYYGRQREPLIKISSEGVQRLVADETRRRRGYHSKGLSNRSEQEELSLLMALSEGLNMDHGIDIPVVKAVLNRLESKGQITVGE